MCITTNLSSPRKLTWAEQNKTNSSLFTTCFQCLVTTLEPSTHRFRVSPNSPPVVDSSTHRFPVPPAPPAVPPPWRRFSDPPSIRVDFGASRNRLMRKLAKQSGWDPAGGGRRRKENKSTFWHEVEIGITPVRSTHTHTHTHTHTPHSRKHTSSTHLSNARTLYPHTHTSPAHMHTTPINTHTHTHIPRPHTHN